MIDSIQFFSSGGSKMPPSSASDVRHELYRFITKQPWYKKGLVIKDELTFAELGADEIDRDMLFSHMNNFTHTMCTPASDPKLQKVGNAIRYFEGAVAALPR